MKTINYLSICHWLYSNYVRKEKCPCCNKLSFLFVINDQIILWMCFVFVCHTVLSDPCGLEVTCWERDDFLALLCVMFSCVFVTFPCGALGRVWYLIVSTPDICIPIYFYTHNGNKYIYIIFEIRQTSDI